MNEFKSFIVLLYFIFFTPLGYSQGKIIGNVTNSHLTEISGMVSYSFDSGYFWVHNDSGDKAQVYLIDSLGSLVCTVRLSGINAVDCEDIARTFIHGRSYLLLADIGNNQKNREYLSIYMFPEPKVDINKTDFISIVSDEIKVLNYSYEDKRRDAEAIFVDPLDLEVYIITKRDFHSTVFSFPLHDFYNNTRGLILKPKLYLPFTFVTAADISADGEFILIKNISKIFMWSRKDKEPIMKLLSQPYTILPYTIESQGEAICFDLYRRYFYTVSERPLGLSSYIYRYSY